MTPALAMTTSKGSPFLSSPSAQARTLFRLARSSATSSKLPPLASASFRTCAVAASAFFESRAAPTTCAPCAASERAVSTPSPAETPVTKIRLPRRLIPDKTFSVVEAAPNTSTIVFLLEFVAGPQCPVIQVAAWLAFFHELACIKNPVVGLKPQMAIRLPAHFRARTVSDEARITFSRRNNQKAGHGIHSVAQTFPPLKDPIDRDGHTVRQRCFNARVCVDKVDGPGTSRGDDAKI